jgi:hypothetical protein
LIENNQLDFIRQKKKISAPLPGVFAVGKGMRERERDRQTDIDRDKQRYKL